MPMPAMTFGNAFSQGPTFGLGSLFGGGGGHDVNEIVRYLRSAFGLDIPRGFNINKYMRATASGNLLQNLNAPTGLENLYGPEFQSRAVSATTERTAAPFQEAGRALTSGFLRSGQGGGGQLARGREQLATAQGREVGSNITDLLLGLEGQRGMNIQNMEQIRQARLEMLINFLLGQQSRQDARSNRHAMESAARSQAIGEGIGGLLGVGRLFGGGGGG